MAKMSTAQMLEMVVEHLNAIDARIDAITAQETDENADKKAGK